MSDLRRGIRKDEIEIGPSGGERIRVGIYGNLHVKEFPRVKIAGRGSQGGPIGGLSCGPSDRIWPAV